MKHQLTGYCRLLWNPFKTETIKLQVTVSYCGTPLKQQKCEVIQNPFKTNKKCQVTSYCRLLWNLLKTKNVKLQVTVGYCGTTLKQKIQVTVEPI